MRRHGWLRLAVSAVAPAARPPPITLGSGLEYMVRVMVEERAACSETEDREAAGQFHTKNDPIRHDARGRRVERNGREGCDKYGDSSLQADYYEQMQDGNERSVLATKQRYCSRSMIEMQCYGSYPRSHLLSSRSCV